MKTIFVLAALVAIATASAIPDSRALKDDFQEFLDLVPVDGLLGVALKYLTTDKEFKEFFGYLQGEEFSAVWDQVFALAEVKDVLNYLEDADLAVYDALNTVADFLGLHHVSPAVMSLKAGGLNGFFNEAVALLPLEKFEALFEEKLKTSPEFKAFFEKLRKLDYLKFVELHDNSKELQAFLQKLRNYGLDVDGFFDLVAGFFGWYHSSQTGTNLSTMKTIFVLAALVAIATASAIPDSRALKDDFQEFLDLVPVDGLLGVALKYLTTDKEFKEFFGYLQGEEFSAVWDQVFALAEVKDVLNYLEDADLAVYDALNTVADFLGLHHVSPAVMSLKAGGLNGFFNEAVALLPLEKFEALFEEKLKTSPEFKAFFEKLRSLDYHKFVELHDNSKELQAFLQKLRNYGLDVDGFFDLVAGFFGWE
ncbi:uncharacterized protein LOC134209978 [Armigeres subalbatus]|uniref:uncharacterized protein LOC134209978 n=1 Tax=Armigeres subalbatus TaxID=124917 RepID=UPI002ED659F4